MPQQINPPSSGPRLFAAVTFRLADGADGPHIHAIAGPYPDEDAAVEGAAASVDGDGWQEIHVHPLCLPPVPAGAPGLLLGDTMPFPGDIAAHAVTGWRWMYAPLHADGGRSWVMTGGPWTCVGRRYTTEELAGIGARLVVRDGRQVVV